MGVEVIDALAVVEPGDGTAAELGQKRVLLGLALLVLKLLLAILAPRFNIISELPSLRLSAHRSPQLESSFPPLNKLDSVGLRPSISAKLKSGGGAPI